jgi:hypothetical protein
MQEQPGPAPAPHFDINIDLSGLANLIWQSFIDHIGDLGTAIWTPFVHTLEGAARAVWAGVWGSSANIVTQIPLELTTNFGPYRTIATDPLPLTIGGATLALVLLGLRTLLGSMVGRDHVITHVTGRLIPAVFATLAYPVLIVQGIGLLNAAASGLGQVAIGDALALPSQGEAGLAIPYALLWLLLIWYAIRLLIRLAYSLFRFLVALVFARGADPVGHSANRVDHVVLAPGAARLGDHAAPGDRVSGDGHTAGKRPLRVLCRRGVRHCRSDGGIRPGWPAQPGSWARRQPVANRLLTHGRGCGFWRRRGGSYGECPWYAVASARRYLRVSLRRTPTWVQRLVADLRTWPTSWR